MPSKSAPSTSVSQPPLPPVLTPALRRLLAVVLVLGGLLAINSLYLLGVTLAEAATGRTLQNGIYLSLFLAHLGLGLLLLPPALAFGALHFRRARLRPNRYAIRAGIGLYAALLVLFGSGLVLTRFGFFEVDDPATRQVAYWLHLLSPLAVIWLFVLHRLAGPRLRWRLGGGWAAAAVSVATIAVSLHLLEPGAAPGGDQPEGPGDGVRLARAFEPALAMVPDPVSLPGSGPTLGPGTGAGTDGGEAIPVEHLMTDEVCAECHADIAERHAGSMHRLSSFNNPAYRAAIEDTRAEMLERDGDVRVTRLCAVCHDPVPLFSGRFDDPHYDTHADPAAAAGITCMTCHAITAVNSPRGNGDYRLVDPPRYPFAFSDNPLLKAVNRQLIKAKPAFHKKTLLKPLHRSPEFCAACHKVHLPQALNQYRWLRGQNHYDSFLMSGVSGHRVDSFYYPEQAKTSCAQCHMPAQRSDDPAARRIPGDGPGDGAGGDRAVHDHLFAAANTAVADMLSRPVHENDARVAMMQQAARVDIFGLKDGGRIDGALHAPLRPELPALMRGKRYLMEVVVRTTGMGHAMTQGTADSNELWLDLTLRAGPPGGERVIARSGALDAAGAVDDWSWFGNAYLLDRDGHRITRRNAQDIFVALYDHQIPPGAAAVVHYGLEVPADVEGPITVEAALRYRKFDTRYLRYMQGDAFAGNDLPITTLAQDRLTLPLADGAGPAPAAEHPGGPRLRAVSAGEPVAAAPMEIPAWQRWNDYGIGLLREGKRGESRQAEAAFARVEALGRADGPLNLARVLYREGRLDEAAAALQRAADLGAPPWVVAWYTGLIDRDLGNLDAAIEALEALADTRFNEARRRGFDFGLDYYMLTELGRTLYERARWERGEARRPARLALLARARDRLEQALGVDPENAAAHYNLGLVLGELGDADGAREHRRLHEYYRTDDNAVERAVSLHRSRNPAANHAAEPVAIYPLKPVAELAPRVAARAGIAVKTAPNP